MSTENDLLSAPSEPAKPRPLPGPARTTEVPDPEPRADVAIAAARLREALGQRFRLPTENDAAPPTARVAGLAFWAAACVFVGLIPAGRLVVVLLAGGGPAWYPVVATTIGLLGTACIAAAFAAVHRLYLPWLLLTTATLLLATNIALVYTAL